RLGPPRGAHPRGRSLHGTRRTRRGAHDCRLRDRRRRRARARRLTSACLVYRQCISRSCTACATLIAVLSGGGVAGAASQRPDLVESAVSVSQQGTTLQITDVVRNRGGTTAAASRTGYYWARIRIGGRSVGPLRPASSSRGSKQVRIPSSVPQGSWRLVACADAGARIQESSERNNCRAALRPVRVGDSTPPTFAGLVR